MYGGGVLPAQYYPCDSNTCFAFVCLLKIEGTESVYEIEKIIMHERYGQDDAGYDIALIKLSVNLRYTTAVSPICLPDKSLPDWANNVAVGWGDTQGRLVENILFSIYILFSVISVLDYVMLPELSSAC